MLESRLLETAVPRPVLELCKRLRKNGYGAWVVGGCLRDLLLGRKPEDWDIATTALPVQTMRLFSRAVPTGIEHGTITVLWRGKSYEVTTLRGEGGYSDNRHPDNVFFVSEIEQDLARRDFTINAIAFDPLDKRLTDPFGGMSDLNHRILRTVGEPIKRFSEDGIRVLRAARFCATHELQIQSETLDAISDSLDSFRRVSHERVRDEWLKAMSAAIPSIAFELMRVTGILAITCPPLLDEVGCAQNRCHAFDVWQHTMRCLDTAIPDPILRVAALLHDIGKPKTRLVSEKTADYTFYGHEIVGAEMADEWLRDYRFSNRDRKRIVDLIRYHLVCYGEDWTDSAIRRFIRRVGEENCEDLLALARADVLAKGRPVEDELLMLQRLRGRIREVVHAGTALRINQLAINGHDVMKHLNVQPGPMIGKVLARLLERVIEDPNLNQRERLFELIDRLFDQGEF
ncbi:MAG: HD domain-containing protein [Deltaproteobacteria bacterium]|nr:HD domain-containing protein [Deltaproteobacteria bacterium]